MMTTYECDERKRDKQQLTKIVKYSVSGFALGNLNPREEITYIAV